ncbi:rhotekin-2 [Corythoichthys intestinalis]|uniref:rhotekin-2 n=1 Tax=Corythoichthys intestinalis TaxID=161448 RepID=UPI0025A578E3|nr:rhotekin-2 [Corythoichthys intestinalis]XP_061794096.1 rhotekin-2-like [Nerophis lumbriciformis]
MDDQREVQNPKRNKNSSLNLSGSSAVAMEIKRKKIRQSALFQQTENTNIQKKLDFELRMREGAYKLLLACSKREQILNASKNLLTCNARIKAYMDHMQKMKDEQDIAGEVSRNSEERVPCRGRIALSGLRLPLMWKDQDHFNNRGSSRRVAIFCLMQMGCQVFDTKMVVVDRTITDVCFDEVAIFQDAVPGFKLRVELWSCAFEEELNLVNTPRKLAKKLRNSFGKTAGKKLCPLLDSSDPDTFLQSNPVPPGAKYNLLAYSTMRLPEAEGSFQSHSLVVLQNSDWSSWLPLYGNLCCRLVAQPACMTQRVMTGYLNQKQSMDGFERHCSFYCILSASTFSCYFSPEEIDAKVQPALRLAINKDTRVRVVEKQSGGKNSRSLSIINPSPEGYQTEVFTADTREELDEWQEALHQHLYDQSQWLHCCKQLMKIEVVSPRKPSLFLTKQADSVYDELSISSPGKLESITDIIHSKIEETDGHFLIGHNEARQPPNWSTLFDGSHTFVSQKKTTANVVSHSETCTPCSSPKPCSSSTPNSGKKRRAPPPPTSPYAAVAPPLRPDRPPRPLPLSHLGKENTSRLKSKTGRPSLDAKFSAIIQQLQHNNKYGAPALGRKNAPLAFAQVDGQADEVPVPRSNLRKSFRERMNFKANI